MVKKKLYKCMCCGAKKEASEILQYVDGNNISITKNSPQLCYDCYVKKYGKDK